MARRPQGGSCAGITRHIGCSRGGASPGERFCSAVGALACGACKSVQPAQPATRGIAVLARASATASVNRRQLVEAGLGRGAIGTGCGSAGFTAYIAASTRSAIHRSRGRHGGWAPFSPTETTPGSATPALPPCGRSGHYDARVDRCDDSISQRTQAAARTHSRAPLIHPQSRRRHRSSRHPRHHRRAHAARCRHHASGSRASPAPSSRPRSAGCSTSPRSSERSRATPTTRAPRGCDGPRAVPRRRADPLRAREGLPGPPRRARHPRPLVNHVVEGKEVDFFWPDQRVIVETDGRATHFTLAAFEGDRARDTWLVSLGYRVLRFTELQVRYDGATVAERVAAALATTRASR